MVISPLSFHVLSTISVTFNQEKRIEIGVDTEIGGYREFQHRCYINVTTSIAEFQNISTSSICYVMLCFLISDFEYVYVNITYVNICFLTYNFICYFYVPRSREDITKVNVAKESPRFLTPSSAFKYLKNKS